MSYYQVTVDGEVLADQSHSSFRMSAGKLKQQISNAGSLSITIPKKNTVQRKITKMESVIEVLHDERPIWSGRCNAVEESSVGKVKIGAEGMLCALKDTILAPQTFSGLDYLLFDAIIAAHNSAARNVYQRFTSFVQHAPYFVHTLELKNYTTAWAVLEAFLKECGGFYLPVCSGIDMKNGILWDCQFTDRCEQVIREGVGLLSFKRTQKADGTYNAILPTGKLPKEQQTEGGDNNLYLTGYSYSNGIYVSESSSKLLELNISPRFRRVMYKHYNDIETQADLAAAAVNDLAAASKESDIVEVKALDMSFYDPTIPPLQLGKLGRVCATRYDYDDWLPVVERELDLVKPSKSTVVLGGSRTAISSMTGGGSSSGGSVSSGRSSEESAQHAVLYVVQELTNNQKAVARQNIGAASASDIPSGGDDNVQSDWNQTDVSADDYIKNKPTIPSKTSDLSNDSGFLTSEDISGKVNKSGDSMSGNLQMAMNKITSLGAPTSDYDAATKKYVDDLIVSGASVLSPVISKNGNTWSLTTSGTGGVTWKELFDSMDSEIMLIVSDGTNIEHLWKSSVIYPASNNITSVDMFFSSQRYNGRTAEGRAFKITVPSSGAGTITEITGSDIPTGGGSGSGGSYIKFNINESTLAVTDSSGTAVTGRMILNVCWSNSVVLYGTERTGNSLKYNCYHLMEDDLADGEMVRFFRPTSDGVVVLTIGAADTTATRTVIPFGSGSGNFVKITYNSNTTAVTHNGTAITGTQIKALLDQQDAGAIMVDTNGNPNGVYRLRNIYANGDVEFEGELGDVVMNVVVPAASSTGNATVTRKAQVYYYLDGTTVKSAVTNYAVTGQQIQNATIDNGLAPIIYKYESSNYITYEYHYFAMHSGGMIFRTLDGKRQIFLGWDSSTATITQAAGWAANILFYLDGTTVKYSGTNTTVTGADVNAITIAVGIMPVIRQTVNAVDRYFHLDGAHSGGLEFRLLDGTKKLVLNYTSSTVVITNL